MKLTVQKRLAAGILGCSPKRVVFHTERLDEIKEAITREDIRGLVADGAIIRTNAQGVSRARANKRLVQYRKGRRKGQGSQKGKATARLNAKTDWIHRVRLQRAFLANLKEKGFISKAATREVYTKIKGGFFRNKRHVKLFMEEKGLFLKKEPTKIKKKDTKSDHLLKVQ
ncbi:MAG: 50S ribosomal protein L19e [archaeon]